jgi:HD-like signal output (HDOD) protein
LDLIVHCLGIVIEPAIADLEYLEIACDRLSRNQWRLSKTAVKLIPLGLFIRISGSELKTWRMTVRFACAIASLHAQRESGISHSYTKEECRSAIAQLTMTILPKERSPMPEYFEIACDRSSEINGGDQKLPLNLSHWVYLSA